MELINRLRIRKAQENDSSAILALVKELALFEKAPEEVKTTLSDYKEGLKTGLFQVIVADHPDLGILGMALYFPYFSTWGGKTMYLEDFVVKDEYRRFGIGKLLFDEFVADSRKQGAKKLKWQVLDWNVTAKEFYKKYHAKFILGWENGIIEF